MDASGIDLLQEVIFLTISVMFLKQMREDMYHKTTRISSHEDHVI